MSDHKFEKQVRQRLDDLKLTPTPESWEKIENEIRERKRRTAPIFWLPLLLLGLGAGGYFLLKPSFKGSTLAVKEIQAVTKTDNITTPGEKVIAPRAATEQAKEPTVSQPENRNTDKLKSTQPNVSKSNLSNSDITRGVDNIADKKSTTLPVTSAEDNASVPQEDRTETKEIAENNETSPGNEVIKEEKVEEKTQAAEVKPSVKEEKPAVETAKPSQQKPKSKSKKWAFGVTGFAGVSAINEGKFGNIGNAQVEDVATLRNFTDAPNFSAAPPFITPTAAAPPPPPSKLYPGFSFSAGVTAKRELSKRFSLSAGVGYLQLNTVTKVGYKMDNRQVVNGPSGVSVVSPVYLPTEDYVNEYKNKYHFIEVPVILHTRINKSERLPIYWNAGVSASALVGSTALHYDGARGVYYKDDALLNEFQGALSTGFSFSLFNKSSKPLWIGPSVRYNISPALKKDVSTSKNFMGLGLDMRWYLK